MNKYRILKDGELIASQMTAESDMRFALAEWFFESEIYFDMGFYFETETGYAMDVDGHQYEIQPLSVNVASN